MSLITASSPDGSLLTDEALATLRRAIEADGQALLLVPSFGQAYVAQRRLSQEEGLSLGVTTTTPSAWVSERWDVWGDGRALVTDVQRIALMRLALDGQPCPLGSTSGVLASLVRIARSAFAFLPEGIAGARDLVLSAGEQEACAVLGRYGLLLEEHGLVEQTDATCLLAGSIPSFPPIVVSGFAVLPRALRTLLDAASTKTDVTVFHPQSGEGPVSLSPDVELRLLEAAGPLAEWELVAKEVADAAQGGSRDVAVVVADVERAWRELAPRLHARGISASCALRRRAAVDATISSFLGFASSVAHLYELAQDWPEALDGPEGPVPQLGDMSWWPPRALIDFLLSAAAHVDHDRVWALDAKWRGNRLLTPQTVLDQLQRESLTSRCVAQATASILKGRVGTAALQLERSLGQEGEGPRDAMLALGLVQDVAREVGALGMSAQPRKGVRHELSLSGLVALMSDVVSASSIGAHVALTVEDASCDVRICSRQEALGLEPGSCDVVVCCSMTAAEWPLAPTDDAAVALLEHLGAYEVEPPLSLARRQFAAGSAAARKALLLEHALHDADAKPTYPAVVLTEALSAREEGAPDPALSSLSEGKPDELLFADGRAPLPQESLACMPAGIISESAMGMVVVPREGEKALPDGVPSLSASQIESYLECPYKWFTLRRLGLENCDAGFSAMEMGSFAHRVLEVSRRRLMQHAAEAAGIVKPGELLDLEGGEVTFVPGSSISDKTLPLARELVLTEFDYHLMHQRQRATTQSAQALVPHTATEEYRLSLLRDDLVSAVEFENGKLVGFEPRYFELRFGGKGPKAHHVRYAGVDFVGSIDRVDVDAHGRAVVIDYKHKGALGFAAEYDVFPHGSPEGTDALELPRRVQSLIYAQVVRRLFPELKVVGAVYLSTQGGPRRLHEIAGALDANAADQVMGPGLSDRRWAHLVAGGLGKIGFEELLDETERLVAQRIARLVEGHIEANPVDDHACAWCPVANCERRLG